MSYITCLFMRISQRLTILSFLISLFPLETWIARLHGASHRRAHEGKDRASWLFKESQRIWTAHYVELAHRCALVELRILLRIGSLVHRSWQSKSSLCGQIPSNRFPATDGAFRNIASWVPYTFRWFTIPPIKGW